MLNLFDNLDEQTCNQLYDKHNGDIDAMLDSALLSVQEQKQRTKTDMGQILASLTSLEQKLSSLEVQVAGDGKSPVEQKAPKAIIFHSDADQSQSTEAVSFLKEQGLRDDEIFHSCLPSHDLEVEGHLKNLRTKDTFANSTSVSTTPMVSIWIGNKAIYNLDELKQLGQEKVKVLLETSTMDESEKVELPLVEKALDYGISLVQYGFGTVWSYLSYFGVVSEQKIVDQKEEASEDIVVLHTNWYWRRLSRIFRFNSTSFFRVHPTTGEIRAVKKYSDVEKLHLLDQNTLVIHYKDGGSPDQIFTSMTNLKRILSFFVQRPDPPKIVL